MIENTVASFDFFLDFCRIGWHNGENRNHQTIFNFLQRSDRFAVEFPEETKRKAGHEP